MRYTIKNFENFPFAHRNWRAESHCRFVHGYCRSFEVVFRGTETDTQGFLVDFGGMGKIREFLNGMFDHTLILQADDPKAQVFIDMFLDGLAQPRWVPDVTSEGLAQFVAAAVHDWVKDTCKGRVEVVSVTCRENSQNAGAYNRMQDPAPASYKSLLKRAENMLMATITPDEKTLEKYRKVSGLPEAP